MGFIAVIALELTVFNFSALSTLFIKQVWLSETESGIDESGAFSATYETGTGEDFKLNNLYLNVDAEYQKPVTVRIYLTDEGNYYEYFAGETVVASETKATRYVNIHPSGKVKSLRLVIPDGYGTIDEKGGIHANVKRPLFFNVWRVLALYLIFVFWYALRLDGGILRKPCAFKKKEAEYRRQLIISIACVIIMSLMGLFWTGSHKLFNEASKPHHQQYKELSHALKEGKAYLPQEPSEALINAENPYDTIYLQANGIDYLADYAYFDGKYYVYFGIVPELLIYLPYYLITGRDVPNHAAVFLFYTGFAAGVFLLYRQLVRRYFKRVSFSVYLILCVFTLCCPAFAYIMFTADLYSVPIIAGLMFTVWGLALWLTGLQYKSEKAEALCYLAGSLCMALVAGCRPQMLMFSSLFAAVFYERVIKERKLFNEESIGRSIALVIPYAVSAAGIMYYNYIRFGSVFDFGATYSLTSNDMNHRNTGLSGMLLGLMTFLFNLPEINGIFPFIHSRELDYTTFGYIGRLTTEFMLGGIITTNVLTWVIALTGRFKAVLKEKKLTLFIMLSLISALVIGLADAAGAGMLERYTADMALGIMLSSSVMLFVLTEYTYIEYNELSVLNNALEPMKLTLTFIKAGFIFELIYSLLVKCNTASGITLLQYNPELFYKIRAMFIL